MNIFFICCDISKIKNPNFYTTIWDFPESYQVLESLWVIKTELDPEAILHKFIPLIDESGIFIVQGKRNFSCTQALCSNETLLNIFQDFGEKK